MQDIYARNLLIGVVAALVFLALLFALVQSS
jgi:hypothetical protein